MYTRQTIALPVKVSKRKTRHQYRMSHTVPEISLKQMRIWRRRLGMSEEEIVTRHAVFCTKYPGGQPWQYPAGRDTIGSL